MRALIRHLFVVPFLIAITTGCRSANTAPSLMPSSDLSGIWSGVVGAGSGGGNALRVTWVANENGSTVSGTATLSTSPAVTNVRFAGTLTGTLVGSELTLMYAAAAENVPASSGCSATGSGSAAVSDSMMSGSFSVSFTSCEDLGLQPPASHQFTLMKQ